MDGRQQIKTVAGDLTELILPFQIQEVSVPTNARGYAVFQGLPTSGRTGCPALPMQPIKILLPPDARAQTVSILLRDAVVEKVPGAWYVLPAGPPIGPDGPVWPADRKIVEGRDIAVYEMDAFYPESRLNFPRHG